MTRSPSQASGEARELRALQFLQHKGLTLEQRNYRSRLGEIDLIMRDNATLVFVEVRYRANPRFGGAAASIGARKQQRIVNTAMLYLRERFDDCDVAMRFDVIAIDGPSESLTWIPAAFEL